ncbi:hypothetical protein AVEN_54953-1 [Araneus ventricosus]|uniref:Uncharacterized protein n=1 Tax=Araneus ventricosus TaxID=182803 RepID=A0A4Y2HSQ5_ARAVE|nr:hypothetical protein AVEN_54953-1 [Araneus ventricosus]
MVALHTVQFSAIHLGGSFMEAPYKGQASHGPPPSPPFLRNLVLLSKRIPLILPPSRDYNWFLLEPSSPTASVSFLECPCG